MHNGSQHVKFHGAMARLKLGNHELAARCAFAKDILNTFLGPVKREYAE